LGVASGSKIRSNFGVLPKRARRSRRLAFLIYMLYSLGPLMGNFQEALVAILGSDTPNLSPSVIFRLTGDWQQDHDRW